MCVFFSFGVLCVGEFFLPLKIFVRSQLPAPRDAVFGSDIELKACQVDHMQFCLCLRRLTLVVVVNVVWLFLVSFLSFLQQACAEGNTEI